jgi:hypothetical protein
LRNAGHWDIIACMSPCLVRKISAYAIPFLLVCQPALPWGAEGHRIVAAIAARKLALRTQQKIVALLRSDPNDDLNLKGILGASGPPPADALEQVLKIIAVWPDIMPGGKGATGPWHYVDIGLFEGPSHIAQRCANGACVTQKISDLTQNLKTKKKLGAFTRPKELRFLVHFLGDIHQPLHCATNADAGGNCIKEQGFTLRFPDLHSVWDTALVDENIKQGPPDLAGAIIQEFDGNFTVPAVNGPNAIAAESFELAKKVYSEGTPHIPVIDHFVSGITPQTCATTAPPEINAITLDARASYDNPATLKDVRIQLYKGGVRLAEILNSIFDHP